ncbi:unnamed protein product, partial [Meganyctiphanes norvegica]
MSNRITLLKSLKGWMKNKKNWGDYILVRTKEIKCSLYHYYILSWGKGLIATNYEARAKGVKKGNMRGDDARASCPNIQLIQVPVKRGKADLTKYRLAGKEVINVLCEFSEVVERASIDEAYIDLTDSVETRIKNLAGKHVSCDLLKNSWVVGYDQEEGEEARKNGIQEWLHSIYNSDFEYESEDLSSSTNHKIDASHPHRVKLRLSVAALICEEMRAEVLARTGFKCSAGISHNKMLGKLACGLHKPNQQTVLPMENVPQLWEKLPVHKIRNLGGKLGESLVDELGCRNMGDLSRLSLGQLRGRYDDKTALWLHGLGRGICPDIVTARQLPKSIGCGKNFQGREALNTKEKVQQWMRSLCDELSERLEEDKEANKRQAKTIHVSVRLDNDIGGFSKQCPLPSYVSEKICSIALSLINHTNTAHDHRWVPCIKNISLSAGKFEDSTGSGSHNIQDMFKKAASIASTQRSNFIRSSQFGEDMNLTLNSSISTILEEKKVHKSKMGPLQSMLEKQLLLQESFTTTPDTTVKDFEEKPKTTKSFFKQFMIRKKLEQNDDTSDNVIVNNNEDQGITVDGEESEDELDLLVSHLEDDSSSGKKEYWPHSQDKSDSDAAYDAPTDIDSSFNSKRTNSSSQDLFADDESSNYVLEQDENNSLGPESNFNARPGEDLEINSLNQTKFDEKMKISVSELFPDLDSIDESIFPMLPVELRTEVEKALKQHRAKATSDNIIKKTGIWKFVSKSPTKQDSKPSTSSCEGNSRYELESSKSAANVVLKDQEHFVSKNNLSNGLSHGFSENNETRKNSKTNSIQISDEKKCEEDMVICDECEAQVWVFDLPEHHDFHLAVKIQKDFRNQHLTNSTPAKSASSPLNKSGLGSKGKKRNNQNKAEAVKHQKLDLFFK